MTLFETISILQWSIAIIVSIRAVYKTNENEKRIQEIELQLKVQDSVITWFNNWQIQKGGDNSLIAGKNLNISWWNEPIKWTCLKDREPFVWMLSYNPSEMKYRLKIVSIGWDIQYDTWVSSDIHSENQANKVMTELWYWQIRKTS